jgi:hypothetical protein
VADQWYVEICIETTLSDDNGDEVRLKGGAPIGACETDLEVMPPCELSSPSFARCVTFSELVVRQNQIVHSAADIGPQPRQSDS